MRGAAHIATEAAFRKEGAQTTFVPFSGGADAITAMLGGHIEAVVSADYGPQLAAGKVKLVVLTGSEKLAEPAGSADIQGSELSDLDGSDLRTFRTRQSAARGGRLLGRRDAGDDGDAMNSRPR